MDWYIYAPCIVAVAAAFAIGYVKFKRRGPRM
jgi:hypothetical protein